MLFLNTNKTKPDKPVKKSKVTNPTSIPFCDGPTQSGRQLRIGNWMLDLGHRRLIAADGRRENLTRGEYELLAILARHPGMVIGRERLMQAVFHRSWDPCDRTIDVLVSRLRDKLEQDPKHPELIVTIRGEGYLLGADVGPL